MKKTIILGVLMAGIMSTAVAEHCSSPEEMTRALGLQDKPLVGFGGTYLKDTSHVGNVYKGKIICSYEIACDHPTTCREPLHVADIHLKGEKKITVIAGNWERGVFPNTIGRALKSTQSRVDTHFEAA